MTAELVEKVARALYLVTNEWTQSHDCWSSMPEYGREVFHDRARAIIPIVAQHCAEIVRREQIEHPTPTESSLGYNMACRDIATALEKIGQGDGC